MNIAQRALLIVGLLTVAGLLADHYLVWRGATWDESLPCGRCTVAEASNSPVIPIFRQETGDPCPFMNSPERVLSCQQEGDKLVYHWHRWYGFWVRQGFSASEGFYAGTLVPLLLIIAAGFVIADRWRR